jgi:hypothetical protein
MFDIFGFIRRKVSEAIVNGAGDGLRALTPEGEEDIPDIDSLRKMIATAAQTRQLGAPQPEQVATTTEEPAKKGRSK